MKDPYLEGELPFAFKDLRAELMILMNYQTRLHTFFGKREKVQQAIWQANAIESYFDAANKTYDTMANSLDKYRFGGLSMTEKNYGWSNNRDLIAFFFEHLKKNLESDIDLRRPIADSEKAKEMRIGGIISDLNDRLNLMSGAYGQFVTNCKRFGLIHRLKSIKMSILDLLALYGVYKHYYRFANENALFEYWRCKPSKGDGVTRDAIPTERIETWETKRNNVVNRVKRELLLEFIEKYKRELKYDEAKTTYSPDKIKELQKEIWEKARTEVGKEYKKRMLPIYKLGFDPDSPGKALRYEVDIRGFLLADIHKIEIDYKNLKYIRRVKIGDIDDFPGDTKDLATYSAIYPKILSEWDFHNEDLRFGTYHTNSRSDIDYTNVMEKLKTIDMLKNIGKTPPDKQNKYFAFDLEAFKISGKFVYWGRRNYWDTFPELKNPYPMLSTAGLSRFMTQLIKLRVEQNEIYNKYLSYWIWDSAGPKEDMFTTLLAGEKK
ncbi:hypothetical protein HYT53_01265 [Candidatus Woesearchaeota archaeon]|nr:hypothetical protein [Candidatus Woesearchaeota archaeon]